MKLFIDANILISVLNKELTHYAASARVLSLVDHSKFELITSPMCLAISFYFSQKKSGEILAKKKIGFLMEKFSLSDHNKSDVFKTISNPHIHDFEDGLEYYSALSANCSCIITHDVNDFYFSSIEVLNPKDFLVKFVL